MAEWSRLVLELDAAITGTETATPATQMNHPPKPGPTARSVVSLLPRIDYKEQHESGFERSLEYVQVQRTILGALKKHDTILQARDAYEWTCKIDPYDRVPRSLQALRLCYYMRSLGYDTYANILKTYVAELGRETLLLRLLVVNPDSGMRGLSHDHLYWAQDMLTDTKLSKAYQFEPHLEGIRPGMARPVLTLDTSRCAYAEHCVSCDKLSNGTSRLRGGEASEPYRYSGARKGFAGPISEQRIDLAQDLWRNVEGAAAEETHINWWRTANANARWVTNA